MKIIYFLIALVAIVVVLIAGFQNIVSGMYGYFLTSYVNLGMLIFFIAIFGFLSGVFGLKFYQSLLAKKKPTNDFDSYGDDDDEDDFIDYE